MASSTPVPMLEGWNNSPYSKLDYILVCMLTSEASQSNFFRGNIRSIQFELSKYRNNQSGLREDMISVMRLGLSPYFDEVEVNVTINDMSSDESKLEVEFQIQFKQSSESYSARRLAYMVDSKFVQVVTINNG